ncbi:renalase isoform X1 [Benincasa hispida]|uniref:renalase isoform X1 n=2 Tax=Benincasa hispida TaxID=102211 RepID=UPI0018FF4FEE|nr:renalase isoform X1 [Benincasa hispida]XP_038890991.1 renalase isoform X1 [Benincasa hispida]
MSSFTHFISSSLILQPLKISKPSIFSSKPYRNRNFTLVVASDSQSKPNSRLKSRKPTMDGNKPTTKFRRKSSYGTSRRSILKKTFNQEQVTFTSAFSDDPLIAIIGGGMAGIMCALSLEKRGVRSTVFDTGIHGLGGRMGTRSLGPEPLIFDHAAQFFTVTDNQFAQLVDGWLAAGLVKEWKGTVGELELGGRFVPMSSCPRYIGTNGMRPLADSLLSQTSLIDVIRPCWISKLEPFNGMWHLSENGKPCGHFDAVVIAHNGKCANRLLATSGLPLIARQMKRLELSSIWALLAAFEDPLPSSDAAVTFPFEGAFVKGVDSISWMANNNNKFLNFQNDGPHCWTFLSTAAFGKQNKVPQENIPTSTAEKVKKNMLEGVEAAMGLSKGSLPKPFFTRVQLWGAALPTNSPNIPCIFDPHGRAGICGDWLLGSNIESAALSGIALGNHIADYFQSGVERSEEFAVGLHNEFQPIQGHDIGQFPGLGTEKQAESALALQHAT